MKVVQTSLEATSWLAFWARYCRLRVGMSSYLMLTSAFRMPLPTHLGIFELAQCNIRLAPTVSFVSR
jgi:hypothetical protein